MNWEDFRSLLNRARAKPGPQGGRPSYDGVLLFQMLALSSRYGRSDEQLEYQVKERRPFLQFLGLDLPDRVLESTTVWLFREELGKKRVTGLTLFQRFDRHLRQVGYETQNDQIMNASMVEMPTLREQLDKDHEPRRQRTGVRRGRKNPVGPTSATKTPSAWIGNTSGFIGRR